MRAARILTVFAVACLLAALIPAVALAVPANDNFSAATVLSGTHVNRAGDSSNGASAEGGEPSIAGCGICASIWYAWTPSLSGPVTITTTGSNFDTVLGVYTGSVVTALSTVAENDDDPSTGLLTSRVHFDAVGGTTYRIAIAGYGGDTGSVSLRLYEGPVSTLRVSLTDGDTQIPACGGGCGNSYNSGDDDNGVAGGNRAISSDGTKIVFANGSNNVVTGDAGGLDDVFVRDTTLGTTSRASLDSTGANPNSDAWDPNIDASGTKVVFTSDASDLVAADGNGVGDIFLRDMTLTPPTAGAMTRVSQDTGGTSPNDWSGNPTISSDGTKVAYESWATDLTAPAGNGNLHVYVAPVSAPNTAVIASMQGSPSTTQGNNDSWDPTLDADGSMVAFESSATNLLGAGGDTNGQIDVYARDMTTGAIQRVSVDSNEAQATGGGSRNPSISSDGTKVVFESDASNLVASDTNGSTDVFLRDLSAGTTTRISVRANGIQSIQGKGDSFDPVISPDGRYVLFASNAANLVSGDTNGTDDIFLHDNTTNVTSRISVQTGGDQAGGWSEFPDVSANGVMTWTYDSGDLVTGDSNNRDDIFTRTIGFQGDALIKGPSDSSYAGDGVYQASANGSQAKLAKAAKGSTVSFGIQVQNDGSVSDAFSVAGCSKKAGFSVSYTQGGTNITSAVTGSTYSTGAIAPDDSRTITLAVKLSKKAKGSLACAITVTSASDGTKVDQVKATTKALR